jgi:hypothetical protein
MHINKDTPRSGMRTATLVGRPLSSRLMSSIHPLIAIPVAFIGVGIDRTGHIVFIIGVRNCFALEHKVILLFGAYLVQGCFTRKISLLAGVIHVRCVLVAVGRRGSMIHVYNAYCRVVIMSFYTSIGNFWMLQEYCFDVVRSVCTYGRELSCELRYSWISVYTEYLANLKVECESRRLN